MTLGEKLRAARIDAGMTQKQLSDGIVTRNMLSQIENGTATPSMKTLEALAQRLNKSISFLLEDAASPNARVMDHARCAFENGIFPQRWLIWNPIKSLMRYMTGKRNCWSSCVCWNWQGQQSAQGNCRMPGACWKDVREKPFIAGILSGGKSFC